MPIRKDYIEQMIQQFAEAIARLLKLRQEQKYDQAIVAVKEGCLTLLGMEYGVLTSVDAGSAAQLLSHPEKIKVLAKLEEEEAELLRLKGNASAATDKLHHALALLNEAQKLQKALDPTLEESIQALLRKLDA